MSATTVRKHHGLQLFTISNFLTKSECLDIILDAENKKFKPSAPLGGGNGMTGREEPRTSQFSIRNDNNLASTLWHRIKELLPPDLSHLSSTGYLTTPELARQWSPISVNPHIRIYKYKKGESFPEHVDYKMRRIVWRKSKKFEQLTFMTMLVYLNDDFKGGQTGFWTNHDTIGHKEHCRFLRKNLVKHHDVVITPIQGMVLINDQCLLHEGLPPRKGCKYVLRTDIVHEREIPLHSKLDVKITHTGKWETLFETSCKNYAD